MAYGVKPAVVRVSAYATAKFRYPRVAIAEVAGELTADARNLTGDDLVVDTGAGGSGSGFVIHPNGLILTSVPTFFQMVAKGVLLIAAVIIAEQQARRYG